MKRKRIRRRKKKRKENRKRKRKEIRGGRRRRIGNDLRDIDNVNIKKASITVKFKVEVMKANKGCLQFCLLKYLNPLRLAAYELASKSTCFVCIS